MNTWTAATLVNLGVTVRRLEALRTLAVKSIFFIYTCPPIPAGAGCTFIYLHITLGTGEARFAHTVIAVDAILANAIVARVTGTVIKVYLAVCA